MPCSQPALSEEQKFSIRSNHDSAPIWCNVLNRVTESAAVVSQNGGAGEHRRETMAGSLTFVAPPDAGHHASFGREQSVKARHRPSSGRRGQRQAGALLWLVSAIPWPSIKNYRL
jgi:hypothetical protein